MNLMHARVLYHPLITVTQIVDIQLKEDRNVWY